MKNPLMLVPAAFALLIVGLLEWGIYALYHSQSHRCHAGQAIYCGERGLDDSDHQVLLALSGADTYLGSTWVNGSLPDARPGDEVRVWVDPTNRSDPARLDSLDPLSKLVAGVLGLAALLTLGGAAYCCWHGFKYERRRMRFGPYVAGYPDGRATRDW